MSWETSPRARQAVSATRWECAWTFEQSSQGCSEKTALEGQDLPRVYLAHHELESVIVIIILRKYCKYCHYVNIVIMILRKGIPASPSFIATDATECVLLTK